MLATNVSTQRWSDGLVCFASLGDPAVACKVNGMFAVITHAGSSCLLGLASKEPIRGAVDVGWGVELVAGELYGAIVARAYELESEVAQYPRIVVGPTAIHFLQSIAASEDLGLAAENDRGLARRCMKMLAEDEDGYFIVDYLGDGFRESVTKDQHEFWYDRARAFVLEQYAIHRNNRDSKLAPRYAWLRRYFDARRRAGPAQ
jgi:hypothetical protein